MTPPSSAGPDGHITPFHATSRRFRLAAAAAAVLLLALWLLAYVVGMPIAPYYGLINWHSHELVFGFAVALIAAELLATLPPWRVGERRAEAVPMLLLMLWLAGRITPLFPALLPPWSIAVLDLAFLPLLASALVPPLYQARAWRVLGLMPILALLWLADLLMQLQTLGVTAGSAQTGIYLALYLLMWLVVANAGWRLPPVSASKPLKRANDLLALLGIAAVAIADLGALGRYWIAAAASIAVLANGTRLFAGLRRRGWARGQGALLLGYGWLVLALALMVVVAMGYLPALPVWHLFTVGAVGSTALALMRRGDPDRRRAGRGGHLFTAALALVSLAAVGRGLMPLLLPGHTLVEIGVAGTLWCMAFGLLLYGLGRKPVASGRAE